MQETLQLKSPALFFVHRHECSISIAFVIWYVGSTYRREPRGLQAPKGLLKLRVWLQVWKLLKQRRISSLPKWIMWKGVNMTALESGDKETNTRPSMRSIGSMSFSQHPFLLTDHSSGVMESCSSARSLLGKASSLTSKSIWKLFLALLYSCPSASSSSNKAQTPVASEVLESGPP